MTAVSVVIPCFTEDRWEEIERAVRSVLRQSHPCEVLVVVDHNDALLERLRQAQPPGVRVAANRFAQGASGGRNTGALLATGELVVFMDDDEVAERDWIEQMVRGYRTAPAAVGFGGAVEARWPGGAPAWFPPEFSWTVGGTVPHEADTDVRNVWGGNMAVRREPFLAVGGFANEFGKVGNASQPEDTELCLRMNARAGAGARWRFVPGAVISHEVPPERRTFRFFLRRSWSEGAGKRVMYSLSETGAEVLDEERDFVHTMITRGVARNLVAVLRGDVRGALRAGAIVAGVVAAGLGYLAATVRPQVRPAPTGTAGEAPALLSLVGLTAELEREPMGTEAHA